MADPSESPTLLQLLQIWPITISVVEQLPLVDLLKLARSNSEFRAVVHDFELNESPRNLRVGEHLTPQWQRLKKSSLWVCSSPKHTKGSNIHLCRHCSDPICEACIVKSSIGKSENTFKNRCRFLCKDCWATDTPHKTRKFTSRKTAKKQPLYNFAPGAGEFCNCTSKDGWLCVPCKEKQNSEAKADGFRTCAGDGCSELLEEDKDRRRVCLWCDRPMLRGRASMESKVAFDQRLIDVRINDLQDQRAHPDDHNSKTWRVRDPYTRRALRGSKAVAHDPDADTPQFLRNLDIVNYRQYYARPPASDYVFNSFAGIFKYDRDFLMQFQAPIKKYPTALGKVAADMVGSRKPDITSPEITEADSDDETDEETTNNTDSGREDVQWALMDHFGRSKRQKLMSTASDDAGPSTWHHITESEIQESLPDNHHMPESIPNGTDGISVETAPVEQSTSGVGSADMPPAYDEIGGSFVMAGHAEELTFRGFGNRGAE